MDVENEAPSGSSSWQPSRTTSFPEAAKRNPQQKQAYKDWYEQQPKWYKTKRGQLYYARKEHPAKTYGTMYVKRGTEENLARFGERWSTATPAQQAARKEYGYVGKGRYRVPHWARQAGHALTDKRFIHGLNEALHVAAPVLSSVVPGAAPYLSAAQKYGGQYERLLGGLHGSGAYSHELVPHRMSLSAHNIMGPSTGNLKSFGSHHNTNQLLHEEPSRMISTLRDETNTIRITHSEFLGDIYSNGGTGFVYALNGAGGSQLGPFPLNPGLAQSFPWLSQIAQYFEEYEFDQLAFHVKSMVTEGNSTASGTIILGTQYNPANSAFNTKQSMENYDYSQSMKVTESGTHFVECDATKSGGNPIEYIRTGSIATNQDIKTYDLGFTQLMLNGMSSTPQSIGELWLSYTVTLRKTKIPQRGLSPVTSGLIISLNLVPTITISNVFAGAVNVAIDNTATVRTGSITALLPYDTFVFPNTGNLFYFPNYITAGRYIVYFTAQSSTALTSLGSLIPFANCSILPFGVFPANGTSTTASTPNTFAMALGVQINSNTSTNAAIQIVLPTGFTHLGGANAGLVIMQLPF